MEHGESERERKQNGQVNMLLFSDLEKKKDLWVRGCPSSTASYKMNNKRASLELIYIVIHAIIFHIIEN